MIAVDTNVLVRHLVRDDAAQARLATALFEDAAERGEPIYLSAVVLAEVVWVLTTVYQVEKGDLIALLRRLLQETSHEGGSGAFVIAEEGAVRRAVDDYAAGRAGFVDYLIGRISEAAGATTTYTLDRAAAAAPTFKRMQSR